MRETVGCEIYSSDSKLLSSDDGEVRLQGRCDSTPYRGDSELRLAATLTQG